MKEEVTWASPLGSQGIQACTQTTCIPEEKVILIHVIFT